MASLMTAKSTFTACCLFGALLLAGACTPTPSDPETKADDDAAKAEPAEAEVPEAGAAPKIACDEATFDFGGVTATGSVEHVFKIKNVGTADLEIEQVKRT